MTDRVAAFIVVLDDDVREDDVDCTLGALRQIKRVKSVEPVIATPELHIAVARERGGIAARLRRLAAEFDR